MLWAPGINQTYTVHLTQPLSFWLCNVFFFFKLKHFFIPKISLTKCKCGEVMGFKVDEALAFIGEKGKEQALKRLIL